MRPIKLTFSSFGPYPKVEVVDFTKLKNSNIFAISGPTGSGKTTIFDAICYALYGSASGSERDSQMFRSQFADVSDITRVELTFSVKGVQYTVERTPRQERPKKRGEGFTVKEATVHLQGKNINLSKASDVDKYLQNLLGMNKDQFKQIVLLPQGEFKKLLLSETREKEVIFRKIFNTNMINQMQDELASEKSKLDNKLTGLQQNIRTLLDQVSSEVTIDDLIEKNQKLQKEKIQLEEAKKIEQLKITKLQNELHVIDSQLKYRAQLKISLARELELSKQKDDFSEIEYVLNNKHNLLLINSNRENYLKTSNKLEVLKKERDELEVKCMKIEKDTIESRNKLNVLRKEQANVPELLTQIEGLQQVLTEYSEKKQVNITLNTLISELTSKSCRQNEVNELLTKIIADEQEYYRLQVEIPKYSTEVKELKQRGVELEKTHRAKSKYKSLNDDIKCFAVNVQNENNKLTIAEQQLIKMRNNFIKANAGMLAKQLHDGESCPVCGSCSHPNKAVLPEYAPSKEEIEEEESKLVNIRKKVSEQLNKLELMKHQLESLKTEFAEEVDYEQQIQEIDSKILELKSEIVNSNSKSEELQVSIQRKNELEQENQKLIGELSSIDTKKQEAVKKLESLQLDTTEDQIVEISSRKEELEGYVNSINGKVEQLAKQYEIESEALQTCKLQLENKISSAKYTSDNLKLICTELEKLCSTVDNVDEYLALLKDIDNLETKYKEYTNNVQKTNAAIVNLKEQIVPEMNIDRQGVEKQLQNIQQIAKELDSKILTAATQIGKYQSIINDGIAYQNEYEKLNEKYKTIGTISDVANGKTASKISFERYMLSVYFKQIIAQANTYLTKMTNNRYLLKYRDTGKGNGARGLNLDVIDNYTSLSRDVKSLSGGECFKASLALALGLSDIIQANSGGIHIEAMFIDEGFGTLDSDSLANAVETLLQIETTGRIIGLISHVEELKSQVENKIIVETSPRGSNLVVNFT